MRENNAPGGRGKHRESTGAFPYDHMFDHNRLWRTWRQRRKERRRASLPERKGSNGIQDPVTTSSTALWDQETVGSSPATRTNPRVLTGFEVRTRNRRAVFYRKRPQRLIFHSYRSIMRMKLLTPCSIVIAWLSLYRPKNIGGRKQ